MDPNALGQRFQYLRQVTPLEPRDALACRVAALEGEHLLKGPHRAVASGAVGGVVIPPAGQLLEKSASRFGELLLRLLPRQLAFKFCVAFYEAGVFFLQCYQAILHQFKLSLEQGDMLSEHRGALGVPERGNQAAERDHELVHLRPPTCHTPDDSTISEGER